MKSVFIAGLAVFALALIGSKTGMSSDVVKSLALISTFCITFLGPMTYKKANKNKSA